MKIKSSNHVLFNQRNGHHKDVSQIDINRELLDDLEVVEFSKIVGFETDELVFESDFMSLADSQHVYWLMKVGS